MANSNYNPDVLNCIANLSNDEVFTPPELANKVLDLLPQDLFRDPNTTFLDPVSKSGVFLREIVKRLDRGLESQIPDRQERIDHILHTQVYGLAITELTSCDVASDVEFVLQQIEERHVDITADRLNWVRFGFAFADQFGEAGRSLYHRLCRFFPKYTEAETDKQYNNCLKSKVARGLSNFPSRRRPQN